MKKTLIVVFVLLMVTTGLHAQRAGLHTFGFRLGGAFGMHGSTGYVYISDRHYSLDNTGRLFNFNAALHWAYTIRNNLGIQAELNFMINQGSRVSAHGWRPGPGGGYHDWISGRLTYTSLDIPILLRLGLLFNGHIGFLAGPHLAIPLGGGSFDGRNIEESSAAFGFTTGFYLLLPIGAGRIVGDLRYVFDFSRAMGEMRRRALPITLGYEMSFYSMFRR